MKISNLLFGANIKIPERREDGTYKLADYTLAEYDAKQFYAFAWVENEDIPELSEYGTVIIERCNGGLWRVC